MYIVQPGRSVGGWPDGELLLLKFSQGRWNLPHGSQNLDMYIDKKDRCTYGWMEGHKGTDTDKRTDVTDRQTEEQMNRQSEKHEQRWWNGLHPLRQTKYTHGKNLRTFAHTHTNTQLGISTKTYTLSTQKDNFSLYNCIYMLFQRVSRFRVINGKVVGKQIFYLFKIFHFRFCLHKNYNIQGKEQ